MKQTKKQRRVKVPARPQVTPRKWSKKSVRIFDKQFDRFLYDELYVPIKKAWGEDDIMKYENIFGDWRESLTEITETMRIDTENEN